MPRTRRRRGPGTSIPVSALEGVQRIADLLHGLVGAVERRAQDGHDTDRVLVALRDRLLRGQVEPVSLHRHEAHLDVPVVRELLPAHLDVDAHHQVRLVRRLARRLAGVLPSALERKPAEHRRLARSRRRASRRLVGVRCVPQPAQDVDASHLELRGLRVLVLVDHVLVEALRHEPLGLRLHPGRDERCDVQARVPVQHQLVVDDLVGDVRRELSLRERVTRDARRLEREQRRHGQGLLGRGRCFRVLQRHGRAPFSADVEYLAPGPPPRRDAVILSG